MRSRSRAQAVVLPSQKSRTHFIFGASAFLLAFNILQPILSVYTRLLDPPAIGPLTWGWLFGFAQFVVPLIVLHLFVARSGGQDGAIHGEAAVPAATRQEA